MSKKSDDIFKEFKENFPEEWKETLEDAEKTKNKISSFARELPAEVYGLVRDEIIARLLLIEKPSLAILNFVVDANIIVKDAFRVGFGRISSTERIFSSVFVKLYAPKSIENEVFTQIKLDLPKGCSLELAVKHARRLLSKVKIIDESELQVESSELSKFEEKYDNDVSFLKVSLALGIEKIISGDRAFENNTLIKRFELGAAVGMIVSVESGALSIAVVGGSAYLGGKAIYWILLLLYKILIELFAFIASVVSKGIGGLVNLMKNASSWVWAIIVAIVGAAGISFVLSEDLRENTLEGILNLYGWISEKSKFILEILSNLINGLTDIAVAFKEELGPYFVNLGFALLLSMAEMMSAFE